MPNDNDSCALRLTRRQALLWTMATPWLLAKPALAVEIAQAVNGGADLEAGFARLEQSHKRRLGVYAVDTGSGREVAYRAGERFAVCSTFKAALAAAILAQDAAQPGLLAQRIRYTRKDLIANAPITEKHVREGMTVADLCAAAIQYSDNTAANLLLGILGGPGALTAYARRIGNPSFRLDRHETSLNTAIPGDERDSSTPGDMGRMLRALVLGNALPASAREQLKAWLLGNKTGDRRIRAAVPKGWQVGDKTGTGDYASANDIGVIWPPNRPPIVVSIYTTGPAKDARADDGLIAEATRTLLRRLA